ncbi:MAG: tetratricopeptide repeat protein [Cyclobacteriaceae bacterium]
MGIFEGLFNYIIGIIRLDKSKIFLLLTILVLSIGQILAQANEDQSSPWLEKAIELRFTAPDSAHYLFEKNFNVELASGDTLEAIQTLVDWSELLAHNANFSASYDRYWQALFLAEEIQNDQAMAKVYSGLGWLYSFFNRHIEAEVYFNKAISILKSSNAPLNTLSDEFYALLTLFRKQKNLPMARAYFDSCISTFEKRKQPVGMFLKAEDGYLLFLEGHPDEALEILLPLDSVFSNNRRSYLVILHAFIAQIYDAKEMYQKSLSYFNSSIEIGRQYRSHQDLIPEILVMKARVSLKISDHEGAFHAMEKAKNMNDSLFSSKSDLNRSLLEIKDEFRLEKERQAKLENEKRIENLEQEERLSQLRMTISYVTILFLAIVGAIYYRYLRSKHRNEKELLSKKQQIEMEKANEILDLKNKELTASALQILKRDETINQIKQQISEQKSNPDGIKLNSIVNTINLSQADDWKQFESRFLSVNQNFYSNLKSQFPKLSPADHKICALIKLGFDSVDMAKLLGIAVESVHTTRYRLRKKMNLSRQDNLEELIMAIS